MKGKRVLSLLLCCISLSLVACGTTEAPSTDQGGSGGTTEAPSTDQGGSGGTTETPGTDQGGSGGTTETPGTDQGGSGGTTETPGTDQGGSGGTTETPEVTASVRFIEKAGAQESIYCEWYKVEGATDYSVYYKKGSNAFQKIDSELIRNYGSYYRADIVGLAAAEYDVKVVPVISGSENEGKGSTFKATPISYIREGFAWVNGTSSGAYNEDGTLKSEAMVLYINNNTKNTITATIQNSNKGSAAATGLQPIFNLIKKGYETRPIAIRFIGQITDLEIMELGDIVIDGNKAGITLEGIGKDATIDGWGIRLKNASNVEIRNLGFMNCDSKENDNVGLQQDNDHIWVHNNDMFYGEPGTDKDQVKGDGALDCKRSTYITFSYNHFYDSGKSNLVGLNEGTTDGLYITFHHNWYDHSDSRHPRVRFYSAHVYNNYYDGVSKYGVGSTMGSSVFSEGNYFRNCKYPMLISMQGSDIYDISKGDYDAANMATFSKEDGGIIKSFNNHMEGEARFIAYAEDKAQFDAYVAASREEQVPTSVVSFKGGNTYNNFDTASTMYTYEATSPEVAMENVKSYAGRIQGGDFHWTFTTEEDESYTLNQELKNALLNYQTKLILASNVNISELMDTIENLTTQPVYADVAAIKQCYATYSSLEEEKKELITNADKIIELYAKALTIEVQYTIELIAILTGDGITAANVKAARLVYEALNDDQKALVTNYSLLESAIENLPQEEQNHNFTESGTTSEFFTISGNLSTGKGTVTYNDMVLTQCLKMEGSTSITFTTTVPTTLTLVLIGSNIKVDGDKINYTGPTTDYIVITKTLEAGDHKIEKAETANLFYMSLV